MLWLESVIGHRPMVLVASPGASLLTARRGASMRLIIVWAAVKDVETHPRAAKLRRQPARYQSLVAVFRQRLQDERSNIQIDYRWAAEDAESIRAYARKLVGLRPDVILARSSPEIAALRDETHTIPIVFAHATDPVAKS